MKRQLRRFDIYSITKDELLIDLIQKMLDFDPSTRISP